MINVARRYSTSFGEVGKWSQPCGMYPLRHRLNRPPRNQICTFIGSMRQQEKSFRIVSTAVCRGINSVAAFAHAAPCAVHAAGTIDE